VHLGLTWVKLGVRFGIPPSIARQIVAATLSGLARGTEGGTANLERLIENVATPGGITEAGIRFLDKARVEDILNATVAHCLARIGSIREHFTSASFVK
jgi:pyrroline-5-carboxylate reductase